MATQKELVAAVAIHMGVPIERVTVIDRLLAEAGLRTRALRGRGSTAMTYGDAANLIIATALDANPKDAVALVRGYSGLAASRVKERDIAPDALGGTFGIALAFMVDSVAKERVDYSVSSNAPNHKAATVHMYGPTPRAEIELFMSGQLLTFQYGSLFGHQSGDLLRSVQFTQITLGFVGEAIAKGAAN